MLARREILLFAIILFNFTNGFYNSIATAFGFDYPYTSFLFHSNDLFGDLIKTALSYPGGEFLYLDTWSDKFLGYLLHNPYGGIQSLNEGQLSNLHGMPLPTIIAIGIRELLTTINPITVVAIIIVPMVISLAYIVQSYLLESKLLIALSLLFSYPMLLAISRAHLVSLLLGALIISYLLNVGRKRSLMLSAFLLSAAVNLRPNSIIFLVAPLICFSFKEYLKFIIVFSFASCFILIFSFIGANWLYPDYDFINFLRAIKVYHKLYLLGDWGLIFGSSLYGGLRFFELLVGNNIWQGHISFLVFLFFSISVVLLMLVVIKNRISYEEYVFSLLCVYALFSGTFADYHLLAFFAFVILYLNSDCVSKLWLQSAVVVLILSAKNYIFVYDEISWQVLLNPVLLFIGLFYTLIRCFNSKVGCYD